jgi:hypothetical protein
MEFRRKSVCLPGYAMFDWRSLHDEILLRDPSSLDLRPDITLVGIETVCRLTAADKCKCAQ